VRAWFAQQPDLTQAEVRQKLLSEAGVSLSLPQVWKLLRKLGLRFKTKSLHATEQDTEANRKQRQKFIARIATISLERLIFPGRKRGHYLDDAALCAQLWRRAQL
jgi:hypothetical protein